MSKKAHGCVKWVLVGGESFPLMHTLNQKGGLDFWSVLPCTTLTPMCFTLAVEPKPFK